MNLVLIVLVAEDAMGRALVMEKLWKLLDMIEGLIV